MIAVSALALITTSNASALAQSRRADRDATFTISRVEIDSTNGCRGTPIAGHRRSTRARVNATDRRWLRRFRAALEREISQRMYPDLDQASRATGHETDVDGSFRATLRWDGTQWQIATPLAPDPQIAAVQSTLLGVVLGALNMRGAPATGSTVYVALQLTGRLYTGLCATSCWTVVAD